MCHCWNARWSSPTFFVSTWALIEMQQFHVLVGRIGIATEHNANNFSLVPTQNMELFTFTYGALVTQVTSSTVRPSIHPHNISPHTSAQLTCFVCCCFALPFIVVVFFILFYFILFIWQMIKDFENIKDVNAELFKMSVGRWGYGISAVWDQRQCQFQYLC